MLTLVNYSAAFSQASNLHEMIRQLINYYLCGRSLESCFRYGKKIFLKRFVSCTCYISFFKVQLWSPLPVVGVRVKFQAIRNIHCPKVYLRSPEPSLFLQ